MPIPKIIRQIAKFILDVIEEVKRQKNKNKKAVGFDFTITDENGKEHENMTQITLHVDKKVAIHVKSPVDSKGRPAKIDGGIEYSTQDGPVLLTPTNDGFDLEIIGANPTAEGQVAQITMSADADLGAGVETISDIIEVTVLPAKAVGFALEVGPEVDA